MRSPHPTLRLLTLLLVSMMTIMASATISPALPRLRLAFEGVPGIDLWVRLVVSLPALFTAMGAPLAGVLIDRFGRKRLLVAAVVLYGFAGTLPGLLSSLPLILVCRALLGLSVGGVMTTATALIADYYAGPERGMVLGRQAAFMGVGGLVFLLGGGLLADIHWRAPFAVYLYAFLLLPLILLFVSEPEAKRGTAGGGQGSVPLPWSTLWLVYALALVGMMIFYLIPVQLPFLLRRLGVGSSALAGLAVGVSTVVGSVVSLRYARVRQLLGYRGIMAVLFACMALGYVIVGMSDTYAAVVGGLAVSGLGQGLLTPNMATWAGEVAPEAARGRVMGLLTTSLFLGQFVSPILAQPLIGAVGLGGAFLAAGGLLSALAGAFGALAWHARAKALSNPSP
ncbi:MFS transporter [Archangium sp.]|uniref:MFS transporter n=1 Tax=Archangium sp. TaxID=1872627 RepID=UPI002D25ED9F|nr:MFS transporter [Archangium sp.]HYO54586.1 MFS transporter [Archangium sp.]